MLRNNRKNIDLSFYHRAALYLNGDLSGPEKEEVEQLILHSDEYWHAYIDVSRILKKTGDVKIPDPDTEKNWKKLSARLCEFESGTQTESEPPHNSYVPHYRRREKATVRFLVPVILSALIILSMVIYFSNAYDRSEFIVGDVSEPAYMEISTGKSERATISLSDGSSVTLNSDSKITTPERFPRNQREIWMEGEAYFSVRNIDGRPFIVHAGNTVTTVLGTRFNIRMRGNVVTVVVEEGRVAMAESIHNEVVPGGVILGSGEMASYRSDSGLSKVRPVLSQDFTAWRFGRLIFNKTPLQEVFEEIERSYDVSAVIIDPDLSSRTLTGRFLQEQLDDILRDIAIAMDIHIERHGSTVKVYR